MSKEGRVKILQRGGANFLYIGDAIYLIDKKSLKIAKTVRSIEKMKRLIEQEKVVVYSLWNLLFYDIILNKGRR